MKTIARLVFVAGFVTGLTTASAAEGPTIPPSVYRVSPPGMKRGTTSVITIEGRSISGIESVLFDAPGITAKVVSTRDLPEEVRPIRIGVDLGARIAQGQKQEAQLEITVSADAEPGVHSFRVETPLGTSNLAALDVGTLEETSEKEPNDRLADAQEVKLPATLAGTIDRPGDVDTFTFEGKAGEEMVFEPVAAAIGSALESVLMLRDAGGKVLAKAGENTRRPDEALTVKLPADGKYSISISDLEERGGGNFFYRLSAGELPYVTEVFPLGVKAGEKADFELRGVNLGGTRSIELTAPAYNGGWETLSERVKTPAGETLNKIRVAVDDSEAIAEREPNNSVAEAQTITVPAAINGRIWSGKPGGKSDDDYFRFHAGKGEHWLLEVAASRLGSPLDSVVEVLDAKGNPISVATARAVMETTQTLADRDSRTANLRLTSNNDVHENDILMMGEELVQVIFVPDQPDEDVVVKSYSGQRLSLYNTSAQAHAINAPVYKVRMLPPDQDFPPNGLPAYRLADRNDDGGPGFGPDSRLDFTAPADADYIAHILDVRGIEGENFAYRLTIRRASPDFELTARPSNPNLPRGGRVPVMVEANRTLGYDGPIDIEVKGLPKGVTASRATIPAGQDSTVVVLTAATDAPSHGSTLLTVPEQSRREGPTATPFQVVGRGKAGERELIRVADDRAPLSVIALMPPPDVVVSGDPQEIALAPGQEVALTLQCKRQNGFSGRVPYQVANLPPGVRVVNIGFTGGFVTEKETSRTITLRAEEWAPPVDQPIYVVGEVESSASTAHVSAPIRLKILPKREMASITPGSPRRER